MYLLPLESVNVSEVWLKFIFAFWGYNKANNNSKEFYFKCIGCYRLILYLIAFIVLFLFTYIL